MKYIDFHCDTLLSAFFQHKESLSELENSMINLQKLKAGECSAQFFAVFMIPENDKGSYDREIPEDDTYIDSLRGILCDTIDKHNSEISFAKSYNYLRSQLF